MNFKEQWHEILGTVTQQLEDGTFDTSAQNILDLISMANYLGFMEADQECSKWIERHEKQ